MHGIMNSGVTAALLVALVPANAVQGDELYFVDAHSQVDHEVVPLQKVISAMRKGGVSHTILSARGNLSGNDLNAFARQYPNSLTPAVRTKGRPYEAGSARYYAALGAQVRSGRYSAMAEVLLYHAPKGNRAPEYLVYPDDSRVGAALEVALDNQWPFVVHIEFGSLGGKKHRLFMQSLENMLDKYPEHPFVLTHMGQLKPAECRRLVESHGNLHFHTGWTNPAAVDSSRPPWASLFEGRRLAPAWRNLFVRHAEKFIFALDNVFSEHWTDFYEEQMGYWRDALAELPPEVAHLVAHGNAERLWRITPRH